MSEQPGAKPMAIDIENVASTEAQRETFSRDIARDIQSPSYSLSDPIFNIAEQNIHDEKHIMTASFDQSSSVPEYIRGTLEQLSGIHKFIHKAGLHNLQRAQIKKLTKELFDYQYKDMQHVLLLGMDIQKKTRFVQYLSATKSLQHRIQRESSEAQAAIIETMFDSQLEAYMVMNRREAKLKSMLSKNEISERQYEKTRADNARETDAHVERLKKISDLLITRHGEFLFKTLELFKTKLIDNNMM